MCMGIGISAPVLLEVDDTLLRLRGATGLSACNALRITAQDALLGSRSCLRAMAKARRTSAQVERGEMPRSRQSLRICASRRLSRTAAAAIATWRRSRWDISFRFFALGAVPARCRRRHEAVIAALRIALGGPLRLARGLAGAVPVFRRRFHARFMISERSPDDRRGVPRTVISLRISSLQCFCVRTRISLTLASFEAMSTELWLCINID